MTADATSEASPLHRNLILASMSLTTLLYAMTLTIINVILPQLQGALSATQDQISWAVTLNVVATGIGMPMTGWFIARFGRRQVLLVAVLGFLATTMMCAAATSLEMLVFARILQGAFSAPMIPAPQAVVLETFPREKHQFALSVWGMGVVIGPAVAPSIGGLVSEEFGWRYVFVLMMPIGAIVVASILAFVRDARQTSSVQLDWTGFLSLAVAIACAQLVMDRGESVGWFESTEIVLMTALCGLSLYIFFVHVSTTRNPFIDLRMFGNRNFAVGIGMVSIYGLLQIAPTVLLPPFLETLHGYPETLIGVVLAMRGAGMFVGFLTAGRMGKVDPRVGIALGAGLTAYSGYMMSQFDFNTPLYTMCEAGVIQGIGSGLMWPPISTTTFRDMAKDQIAQASGIFHLIRSSSSALFVAVSITIVLRSAKMSLAGLNEYISPFNDILSFPSLLGVWTTATLPGLAKLQAEMLRQATMIGYHNAFLAYAAIAAAAFLLIPLIRIKREPE